MRSRFSLCALLQITFNDETATVAFQKVCASAAQHTSVFDAYVELYCTRGIFKHIALVVPPENSPLDDLDVSLILSLVPSMQVRQGALSAPLCALVAHIKTLSASVDCCPAEYISGLQCIHLHESAAWQDAQSVQVLCTALRQCVWLRTIVVEAHMLSLGRAATLM